MNLPTHILMYAFRYAIGRMTYAVSEVAKEIITHAAEIPDDMKRRIISEITDAEKKGQLGHDCDRDDWFAVRQKLESML